jgi:hypothetical protein
MPLSNHPSLPWGWVSRGSALLEASGQRWPKPLPARSAPEIVELPVSMAASRQDRPRAAVGRSRSNFSVRP